MFDALSVVAYFFIDITRDWDLPENRTKRLNPNYGAELLCNISGRPDPTYQWRSNITGDLPSQTDILNIDMNTRHTGDIELITCEGVVGEFETGVYCIIYLSLTWMVRNTLKCIINNNT